MEEDADAEEDAEAVSVADELWLVVDELFMLLSFLASITKYPIVTPTSTSTIKVSETTNQYSAVFFYGTCLFLQQCENAFNDEFGGQPRPLKRFGLHI